MLEKPEARAKMRYRLERWPAAMPCPITVSMGIELLAMIERLEAEADWLAANLNNETYCPDFPCVDVDGLKSIRDVRKNCVNCWRKAARAAIEKKKR